MGSPVFLEWRFILITTVCIIAMAVLTGIYVIAGGYMATAINDFIQGIIMLVGIVAVVAAVLASKGGFMASLDALARVEDPSVTSTPGAFASFFGPDPFNLFCVVILTSLGTWGLPQMVQKFYAIKSEKSISKGAIISTLFAVIVAGGCYFLGGFGRLFSDQVDLAAGGYDSIIPTMLSNLPDLLMGIVVILVLSASMSTLSSLVLASSSTLTLDFINGTLVKEMSEKRQIFVMRLLVVVFVAISAIIAVVQYKAKRHLHCAAHGDLLGRAGGFFPGSVYLWSLLETYNQSVRMGQLYFWFRYYDSQYDLPFQFFTRYLRVITIADQLRRVCHGGRPYSGPARQYSYKSAGPCTRRRYVQLL